MKVFIAENVLSEYTSGMIVISAESKEVALERLRKDFSLNNFEEIEMELRELKDNEMAYVYGGG